MKTKVKTIDINARQWFDKTYGNSYFSAIVTINYQMKNESQIKLDFQYGYGDHYRYKAIEAVKKQFPELSPLSDWQMREAGIIIRSNIHRGCLKRDVINYTSF